MEMDFAFGRGCGWHGRRVPFTSFATYRRTDDACKGYISGISVIATGSFVGKAADRDIGLSLLAVGVGGDEVRGKSASAERLHDKRYLNSHGRLLGLLLKTL